MDANTKAIAEVLSRWHEAQGAKVIDLAAERQRRERERFLRNYTRPMPPPRAA